MKILSWNILANEFIHERYYPMIPTQLLFNRQKRQERIIETLKQTDADIMLLQEVMQSEYNLLDSEFHKSYYLVRGKYIQWLKNKRSYSGNVILIRKSMFSSAEQPIDLDFGLAIRCHLKHSEIPILILNVHLDDVLPKKRLQQLQEIEPLLSSNRNIILGGDFNEHYTSKAKLYNLIKDYFFTSYNDHPTYYIERQLSIDHIMLKGFETHKKTCKVINQFGNAVLKQFTNYGSDHLPVLVTVS